MVSRRKFLSNVVVGSAATFMVNPVLSMSMGKNLRLKNIGYIAGIIGKELKEDWKGVLKKTVEFGFSEYEGGLLGESPEEFLKYCRSIGLKPVAGGVKMSNDMDKVKLDLDKLNALEMEYAVIYWPWLVGGPFKLDDCKRSAEILNRIGELTHKHGLTLCWHNHNKEFIEMEEGLPFHYLMKHTDKDLVKCEMDIYWVAKGGADPLAILKQYSGRFPILHVKDMANDADKSFECPGSGIIDFPSLFVEANRQGIKHYYVERDKVPDGMACLKSSGEYLKNLRF
jgi:sugar phosphate isomerase/epimerase